jgi:hypothetical protein
MALLIVVCLSLTILLPPARFTWLLLLCLGRVTCPSLQSESNPVRIFLRAIAAGAVMSKARG